MGLTNKIGTKKEQAKILKGLWSNQRWEKEHPTTTTTTTKKEKKEKKEKKRIKRRKTRARGEAKFMEQQTKKRKTVRMRILTDSL